MEKAKLSLTSQDENKLPSNIEAEQSLIGSKNFPELTILDISSMISLLTKTDPIKDCSASIFEGNLFSSAEARLNFTFSIVRILIELKLIET